ncbi:MAG: GDP-L-fucose synthase [Acidobacteria bacterium]|nr:GDP-L-fucose synthase [Acidobacteriota bacterium]
MSVFIAGAQTMVGQALKRRLAAENVTAVAGDDNDADLRDPARLDSLFAAARPRQVIVVAGKEAGIAGNQKQPADLMLDSLMVAATVIPTAWRHGVEKLLYLASSCTYPKRAPQPLSVESLWTGPVEPTSKAYAVAKLAGMQLCDAYRLQHGTGFISAIKADTFGPGDDFSLDNSHVVSAVMRRMHEAKLSGNPVLEIWGTGEPRREFIYVDDLADAIVFLMKNYDDPQPINIGTGVTTSIRELAELLRNVTGYQGTLRFDSNRPDGMPLKGLNSAPLRTLGWAPTWELTAALASTYESFLTTL